MAFWNKIFGESIQPVETQPEPTAQDSEEAGYEDLMERRRNAQSVLDRHAVDVDPAAVAKKIEQEQAELKMARDSKKAAEDLAEDAGKKEAA
jgi:hypothetical protein